MNPLINLLKNQTIESHNWVDTLITNFPKDKWFETPEIINSNIAWQIGHLTLSVYYYNVVLIGSPQEHISSKLNLKKYSEFFTASEEKTELIKHFNVDELVENWEFIKLKSIEFITKLSDSDLELEIFKLPKEHPFAKSKLDAISWNIKHSMWHCGQIATITRIIDKPFDISANNPKMRN
jgi:hypothetical protein